MLLGITQCFFVLLLRFLNSFSTEKHLAQLSFQIEIKRIHIRLQHLLRLLPLLLHLLYLAAHRPQPLPQQPLHPPHDLPLFVRLLPHPLQIPVLPLDLVLELFDSVAEVAYEGGRIVVGGSHHHLLHLHTSSSLNHNYLRLLVPRRILLHQQIVLFLLLVGILISQK